jgi:hypothetical protein
MTSWFGGKDVEEVAFRKNISKKNETKNISKKNETKPISKKNETKNISKKNETKNISKKNETKKSPRFEIEDLAWNSDKKPAPGLLGSSLPPF